MNTIFRQIVRTQFSLANEHQGDVTVLRLEQLAGDRPAFVEVLGASLDLESIVDNHPVPSDPATYRSVDPQSWKASLKGELLQEVSRTYGDVISQLGY